MVGVWGPTYIYENDPHIFLEHNKGTDLSVEKGAKGQVEKWVDTVHVVWSEVVGLCGMAIVIMANVEVVFVILVCSKVLEGCQSARNAGSC